MKAYFNRLLVVMVALFVATVVFSQSNVPPISAQTGVPRTAFVQLFEWKWTDIANECETWLGPKGFAAVQVSPPNEHMVMSSGSTPNPWWERYQPVSYSVAKSRSGTAAQFQDMITRCHNAGVSIYVDAIINHTAAASGVGSNGSTFGYPNFSQFPYSSSDFHPQCNINYSAQDGGGSIRYCWLGGGLPDLKTESTYVRGKIVDYMNAMIAMGVAGFRVDAAKHMEPADMSYFASTINNLRSDWFGANQRPYIYQEVIYGSGEGSQPEQYVFSSLPTLDVEEFRYGAQLGGKFRGDTGKLADLATFGSTWGMLGSDTAVSFTDNHDNQRGHGSGYWGADGRMGGIVTFHYDTALYALENVFQLAWPYGYPRLMSSYDWPRNIQNGKDVNDWVGPPSDANGNTNNVTCFSGNWVCEHRWLAIANMVGFRNNVNSMWTISNWWSNGNNQIAFSRGDKGFVVINREGSALSRTFTTGMAAGTYCNVISGDLNAGGNGCTGSSVTVNADGTASISVPAMTAFAIHVGAKVGGTVVATATPLATATATTQAGIVPVTFNDNATTAMGENVFVVGSIPALGSWNATSAVALSTATYPIWKATINIPANTAFEYKYIKKNGATVIWELNGQPNHAFTSPANGSATLNDVWNTLTSPTATNTPMPTATSTSIPTPTPTSIVNSTVRVHYKGWASPKVYAWVGASTALRGVWPGTAMADEGNGWYGDTFPNQTSVNMIFNITGQQTADLNRTTGEWWYTDGVWTNSLPNSAPTSSASRLGATYSSTQTTFAIWSPDTANVTVNVDGTNYNCVKVADFNGYTNVYAVTVPGNLKLKTYQFKINGVAVRDPYGVMIQSGTNNNIVMDMASIQPTGGWVARPALVEREDAIIYEVHVRDFTIDSTAGVSVDKRGKFLGMVETGTKYNTLATGIDHLKELGVTHVQILPFYDFGTAQYNWGYDPINYNVPEEQYSLTPNDYNNRVYELKTMINEFHKNGIRVVMDVVYNHTLANEMFTNITPSYYTGTDDSGCGNGVNSGVPMVSRMIQDSLDFWVREYNIDGFRFDLIGIFHYNEARKWGEYLNTQYPDRNVLIYGEPWNGYMADPNESQKVRMGTVPAMASGHVGVFNGKFREAIKGDSDSTGRGYMFNYGDFSWNVKVGSRGSILYTKSTTPLPNMWDSMFAYDPEQSINYLSAHDNYDLWDKIKHVGEDNAYGKRVDRFGMGMILTAQGIPFIHAGDEMLRTKVVNGDWTYAHNSYNAPDTYNAIRWSWKSDNVDVVNYYKNLITLRKAHPGFRLNSWDEVNNWVSSYTDGKVVVSQINADQNGDSWDEIIVVYNPGNTYSVALPAGTWTKVFDINGAVNVTGLTGSASTEGTAVTVFAKALGAMSMNDTVNKEVAQPFEEILGAPVENPEPIEQSAN